MTAAFPAALEISGLGFSFGRKRALDGIALGLVAGEFKVLLGPNGAGKTTLFSLITRLYESADGEIRVEALEFHPGKPPKVIEGLSREDCLGIHEDSLALAVRWKNDQGLQNTPRRKVCLKFYLKNAQLYSFRIK